MEQLTSYELRNLASDHFSAVQETPGIDHFCSSLDWTLPAHAAFIADQPMYLLKGQHGYVTLAGGFSPGIGRYLQPLEAAWRLASPFAGKNVEKLVTEFSNHLTQENFVNWELLCLSGIPPEGRLFDVITNIFTPQYRVALGEDTRRFIADISGGSQTWLSNRSSKFRANMRRVLKSADNASLEFEHVKANENQTQELYERILAIEAKSWKGMSGTGILDGAMKKFYEKMLPRLARRDALRVIIVKKDTKDIAFIFGGLLGTTYRGLQMSYDNDFRELSLGNLVQFKMIDWLGKEGIQNYDLGSELEYKMRWADEKLVTTTFWIWR